MWKSVKKTAPLLKPLSLFSRLIPKPQRTGLPPGTLLAPDRAPSEPIGIQRFEYNPSECREDEITDLASCRSFTADSHRTWININGTHDPELIRQCGDLFHIHPLLLEDIMNPHQRPRMEDSPDCCFLTLKMITYDREQQALKAEQISLILGDHYLITFQERAGDVFQVIRERLRSGKGRLRSMNTDYLAYALIDAVVDYYYVALEQIGDYIERLQQQIMSDPNPDSSRLIYSVKQELIYLRKNIWPLREMVNALQHAETHYINQLTQPYLKDLYDHTMQTVDIVETYRDVANGLFDMYLSSGSHRMNEVMKVLTIIATIFIPITFVAGIYGMNFSYMPELEYRYGYFVALGAMAVITIGMLLYFRRKKWL